MAAPRSAGVIGRWKTRSHNSDNRWSVKSEAEAEAEFKVEVEAEAEGKAESEVEAEAEGDPASRRSASAWARLRNRSLFITNSDWVGATVWLRWPAICAGLTKSKKERRRSFVAVLVRITGR